MKRRRHKFKQNRQPFSPIDLKIIYRKILTLLFLGALIFSIVLKIYKADYGGITFDERANFSIFARDIDTAVGTYSTTNNHVLNSVFMYYAHKYCGSYEHFIRIPSLIAGVMFSLSIAYIIYKTISSYALRVASLLLVSMVPYVFDYSHMARGYAFALGGIYTAMAFVIWFLDHKVRFRFWLVPVLLISSMNFLTLGPMLSSMLLLAALNAIIVFYSPGFFSNTTAKVKVMSTHLIFTKNTLGMCILGSKPDIIFC